MTSIKQQKSEIAKLEKRHHRIIKEIQSAEAIIEDTLGSQLCRVWDELISYNIELERLMVANHSAKRTKK